MKRADGGYESNLFQGTQCQRAAVCAAAAVGDAVFLRAGMFYLSSFCKRDSFSLRKCVLLRTVLLVPQPVAACGAAALCEEFCCAQCCLCFSPLPRAVLLLCSKSFAARGAACDSARCGAAVAHEVFCCGRGYLFFSALLRAVPLLCARVLFAIKERAKRQAAPGAGVLFICTKAPVSDCH